MLNFVALDLLFSIVHRILDYELFNRQFVNYTIKMSHLLIKIMAYKHIGLIKII